MAKPIAPTPTVKGKSASRILREMKKSTVSRKRQAELRRAIQVYKQITKRSQKSERRKQAA